MGNWLSASPNKTMEIDETQSYASEKSISPPRKVKMSSKGLDFIRHQEEAEAVAGTIIDSIVEAAADEYIERYYHSMLPEYEVERTIAAFDALLEWCFPTKDMGEPSIQACSSWMPGSAPIPCPIDSWACGAVPVRVEPRAREVSLGKDVSASRVSTARGSRATQRRSHAIQGLGGTDHGDKTAAGAMLSRLGSTIGSTGGSSGAGQSRGSGKGASGAAAGAGEEKRGSKIVIRMAQPLRQPAVAGGSTSQNEAIRVAVEAERKQKEEAKEKMAMQARLEMDRTQKLKQTLRGKNYTYTSTGVVLLKPINPDKIVDVTIVPTLVTKKETEAEQKEAPEDPRKKGKKPSTSTLASGKVTFSSSSSKTAAGSTGARGGFSSTGRKDEGKDKTKGGSGGADGKGQPQSLLALFPDKRDGAFKPSDISQPPIPDSLRLQPGVTLKVGDQVRSGGPPRFGRKSGMGSPMQGGAGGAGSVASSVTSSPSGGQKGMGMFQFSQGGGITANPQLTAILLGGDQGKSGK